MKKYILPIALFSFFLLGCVTPSPTDSTPSPQACGGIAGINCPDGYTCSIPENAPVDGMGECVKEDNSQYLCDAISMECPEGYACVVDRNTPVGKMKCENGECYELRTFGGKCEKN